jgi:dTDP-4-amino-4,6-dideoxygalactose transaminase
MSNHHNQDTVVEFWDASTLALCEEQAHHVEPQDFLAQLGSFLRTPQRLWAMASARHALETFLSGAIEKKGSTVLICSFNCPLVADSVIKAGFNVETYDLASPDGEIDWHALASGLTSDHSAVVIPHLFGVPTDFRPLQAAAERAGVMIIEDCAHTLGGTIDGKMAGTIGDAAIFSFNYDKPISLGGGGALLVNNTALASQLVLRDSHEQLAQERKSLHSFLGFLQVRRKRISQQTPFHKVVRKASESTGILKPHKAPAVHGIGPLRAALGIWQLERYPSILQRRNEHSEYVKTHLPRPSWGVGAETTPAWLRQKVIVRNPHDAQKISQTLQRNGLRVGTFNWSKTIDERLGRPERPHASQVARQGLDIPIHQNMTMNQLDAIITLCSSR